MKISIILLTIILFTSSVSAQKILDREQVEIEKIAGLERLVFKNEPMTGVVTDSFENGQPKSWVTYKDGIPDGPWKEWYDNGYLKFNSNWKNGKGHGLWEYFYENGQLRQEEFYDLDIPTGIFRDYYNNGQLKLQSGWLKGQKEGRWSYYSENGILTKTEVYRNNGLMSTTE